MTKIATTIRIEAELRASLNKICVRTGDQTYHIEQALRGYGPIKKVMASKPKQVVIIDEATIIALDTEIFESLWMAYGKKGNKKTSTAKYLKLSKENKKSLLTSINAYVLSTPDKQYRKNLETYINQECWNDEIVEQKATESFVDKHTNKTWQDEIIERDEG